MTNEAAAPNADAAARIIDLAFSATAAVEASALARWELENTARDAAAGAAAEAWFAYDAEAERAQLQAKPWAADPRYFKR